MQPHWRRNTQFNLQQTLQAASGPQLVRGGVREDFKEAEANEIIMYLTSEAVLGNVSVLFLKVF